MDTNTLQQVCFEAPQAATVAAAVALPWIVTGATIIQKFVGKPETKTTKIGKGFATFIDCLANLKLKSDKPAS